MSRDNYVEVKIRDRYNDQVVDKMPLNNKKDVLDLFEKYGNVFLSLSMPELIKCFDMDIKEVEKYVNERRNNTEPVKD